MFVMWISYQVAGTMHRNQRTGAFKSASPSFDIAFEVKESQFITLKLATYF